MTAPMPPTEAFDEQERDLARILHALPAGEPSAALDARILRAAANAAASSRKPQARWLASIGGVWGIGAAAAAVLALGVSWQMLDPSRKMGERSMPVAVEPESDNAVVVELGETRREEPQPMPGPAAPSVPAPTRSQAAPAAASSKAVASEPVPATAAGSDAPTAFAHDGLDEHVAARPEATAQATGRVGSVASQVASHESAEANARADVPAAQADVADSSGLAMRAHPAAGPMKPATWLTQVRHLLAAHRTEEARASLKLFRKRYPNYVVPADLVPLLRE